MGSEEGRIVSFRFDIPNYIAYCVLEDAQRLEIIIVLVFCINFVAYTLSAHPLKVS